MQTNGNSRFASDDYLVGIDAVSADDIWVVGYSQSNLGSSQTLIKHWNGARWDTLFNPSTGNSDDSLFNIASISNSDIWAVGNTGNKTLAVHWDGNSWSIVSNPNTGKPGSVLRGVAAVSKHDVWAVGSTGSYEDFNDKPQTLIEHWDGSQWNIVPSPNPGVSENVLYDLAVASKDDIWAVGYYGAGSGSRTLVQHWDGLTWSVVPKS